MKKNKAIKYRIYPNKEQRELILKTFGCSRFVYNYMLEESIKAHENGESFCTRNSFNYLLTSLKKKFVWLKEVDSGALLSANNNLAAAFLSFFKKNANFPKFHKKKFSGSYTTGCTHGNIALLDKGIKLPKLGRVRASLHRMPKKDWKLKSATVSQSSDGKFYASVLFEYESDIDYQVDINNAIGLDYASSGLFRKYICTCGLEIDRDLNAAINIKNEGLSELNLMDVPIVSNFDLIDALNELDGDQIEKLISPL